MLVRVTVDHGPRIKDMPFICDLPDDAVTPELDRDLRELLCACFTRPHHAVFREHRHFRYPPRHRWLMRDEAGRLIAQAGVHTREVVAGPEVFPAAGLAEVCVHPDVQRRGLMRALLARMHADLRERGVVFAILFGNPEIYRSSGYRAPGPVVIGPDAQGRWEPAPRALVCRLAGVAWPCGEVRVPGPAF